MTCWRRLAAWNEAGVWARLHLVLLQKLRAAKKLDWSRAVIDSCRTGECAAQPIPRKELSRFQ
jgi:transposase